jgi:hypothetical protein
MDSRPHAFLNCELVACAISHRLFMGLPRASGLSEGSERKNVSRQVMNKKPHQPVEQGERVMIKAH